MSIFLKFNGCYIEYDNHLSHNMTGNFMIKYIILKFSDLGIFSDTVHCKGLMHKCIKPMHYTLSKNSQSALNLYNRHLSEKLSNCINLCNTDYLKNSQCQYALNLCNTSCLKNSLYALNLSDAQYLKKLPICIKPMQYTLSEKLPICIKPMQYTLSEKLPICI